MVPQVLLVCTYNSFRHGGVFCDCLVVLFQLNFDFDDFSFEFGDGAWHGLQNQLLGTERINLVEELGAKLCQRPDLVMF